MAADSQPPLAFSLVDLLEMQRRMLLIRGFEERVAALYRDGEVPGFVHLSTGQEAAAVGACWPLGRADVITSTHRGHGHCLAKGLGPLGMFAELQNGRAFRPLQVEFTISCCYQLQRSERNLQAERAANNDLVSFQ